MDKLYQNVLVAVNSVQIEVTARTLVDPTLIVLSSCWQSTKKKNGFIAAFFRYFRYSIDHGSMTVVRMAVSVAYSKPIHTSVWHVSMVMLKSIRFICTLERTGVMVLP